MLEADYVGKTPEEYRQMITGEKEYTVYFSMKGSITIEARNREEAEEIFLANYSNIDLIDYIDETEVDEVD